jgi:hypothetical protein
MACFKDYSRPDWRDWGENKSFSYEGRPPGYELNSYVLNKTHVITAEPDLVMVVSQYH